MAITVRMACGCPVSVEDIDLPPVCEVHHESRVQVVNAGPPRVRAVDCKATGPYVRQE